MRSQLLFLLSSLGGASPALWNGQQKDSSEVAQSKRNLRAITFDCVLYEIDYLEVSLLENVWGLPSSGERRLEEDEDEIASTLACMTDDGKRYEVQYNGESDMDKVVQSPLIDGEINSGSTVLRMPYRYGERMITHDGEDSLKQVIDLSSLDASKVQIVEVGDNDGSSIARISTRRSVKRKGESSVAVIRVITADGAPSKTMAQLSDDIFGTAGDQYNLISGYKKCSGDQLNFYPGEGNGLVDGVREITLSGASNGVRSYDIESQTLAALNAIGFPSTSYDHVMYILPGNVNFGGAAAYAYIWGGRSVYWNTYGSIYLVLIHELGHNLGHLHSGMGSASYGDRTCWMGAHIYRDDGPDACFNGAKSWYFGWYDDRHKQAAPSAEALDLKLVGVDDYLNGQTTAGEHHVIMRLKEGSEDLYIMYNRAEGVNSGTAGQPNEVTIVEQLGDVRQSWLLGHLVAGERYTQANWAGTGNDLVVEVCTLNAGTPDYAKVIAYVAGSSFASCDGSTQSPTTSPTAYSGPNNVHVKYYSVSLDSLPSAGLSSLSHYKTDNLRDINFRAGNGVFATSERSDYVAALFESNLDFSESGTYELCITSDDGSKLFIEDTLVVNNDGLHGDRTICENYVGDGVGAMKLEYFEKTGGSTMVFEWKTPSSPSRTVVPVSAFVDDIETGSPTSNPTPSPSSSPTQQQDTSSPTSGPSSQVTGSPSEFPTIIPSETPSEYPTLLPSEIPSTSPTEAEETLSPTNSATTVPSISPSKTPSQIPSMSPTILPSEFPTIIPSETPSEYPTLLPSEVPSIIPSEVPSITSTEEETDSPTQSPTATAVKRVNVKYYEANSWGRLPTAGLKSLAPYKEEMVETIDFRAGGGVFAGSERTDNVAALYEGWLSFPSDGTSTELCILSDDGSKLFIDGTLAVNNDGLHGDKRVCGTFSLSGEHKIAIEFFERGGGATMVFEWALAGSSRVVVPSSAWVEVTY